MTNPTEPTTDTGAAATLTLTTSQSNRLFDITNLKDDGTNFPMWKFRLQMILEMRKLWGIISRT